MDTWASVAFTVVGALLLVLLVRSFATSVRARDITPTFWMLFLLVLIPNLSGIVSQFTGGRTVITTIQGDYFAFLSPQAALVNQYTGWALAITSAIYLILRLRAGTSINFPALIFVVVLVIGALAGAQEDLPLLTNAQLGLLAPAVALTVAPRNLEGVRGAAYGLGLFVALSAFIGIIAPDAADYICGTRKCGVFGALYMGVSLNFNSLGLLLAAAIPVIYFGLRKHAGWFVSAAAVMVFASGSRTAEIAAAVSVALILMHHLSHGSSWANRIGIVTTAAAFIAIIALPLADLPPTAFTGRSGLWSLAFSKLTHTWLIGMGPNYWGDLEGTGQLTHAETYATHNQFVEVMFVSGVLGVLCFAVIGIFVWTENRGALGNLAMLLTPVFIIATTERPWSLGGMDWLCWSLPLIMVTAFPTNRGQEHVVDFETPIEVRLRHSASPMGTRT